MPIRQILLSKTSMLASSLGEPEEKKIPKRAAGTVYRPLEAACSKHRLKDHVKHADQAVDACRLYDCIEVDPENASGEDVPNVFSLVWRPTETQ